MAWFRWPGAEAAMITLSNRTTWRMMKSIIPFLGKRLWFASDAGTNSSVAKLASAEVGGQPDAFKILLIDTFEKGGNTAANLRVD